MVGWTKGGRGRLRFYAVPGRPCRSGFIGRSQTWCRAGQTIPKSRPSVLQNSAIKVELRQPLQSGTADHQLHI